MTAQAAKVRASATEMLWNEQLGVFMASTGEPARSLLESLDANTA